MNIKVKYIILTVVMTFALLCFGGTAFADDFVVPITTANGPIYNDPSYYCRTHGLAFVPRTSDGKLPTVASYHLEDTYNLTDSPLAYAFVVKNTLGGTMYDIQKCMWYSKIYGDTRAVDAESRSTALSSDSAVQERYRQYCIVYYSILNNLQQTTDENGKTILPLFRVPADFSYDNLKLLVDTNGDGTGVYTVGPYELELNIPDNKDAIRDQLYNQVTLGKNESIGYVLEDLVAKYVKGKIADLNDSGITSKFNALGSLEFYDPQDSGSPEQAYMQAVINLLDSSKHKDLINEFKDIKDNVFSSILNIMKMTTPVNVIQEDVGGATTISITLSGNDVRVKGLSVSQDEINSIISRYDETYTIEKAYQYLYQELIGTNQYYTDVTRFADKGFIEGLTPEDDFNNLPVYIDEEGNQVDFPDFSQTGRCKFYIRFTPSGTGTSSANTDGINYEVGVPKLTFTYRYYSAQTKLYSYAKNENDKGIISEIVALAEEEAKTYPIKFQDEKGGEKTEKNVQLVGINIENNGKNEYNIYFHFQEVESSTIYGLYLTVAEDSLNSYQGDLSGGWNQKHAESFYNSLSEHYNLKQSVFIVNGESKMAITSPSDSYKGLRTKNFEKDEKKNINFSSIGTFRLTSKGSEDSLTLTILYKDSEGNAKLITVTPYTKVYYEKILSYFNEDGSLKKSAETSLKDVLNELYEYDGEHETFGRIIVTDVDSGQMKIETKEALMKLVDEGYEVQGVTKDDSDPSKLKVTLVSPNQENGKTKFRLVNLDLDSAKYSDFLTDASILSAVLRGKEVTIGEEKKTADEILKNAKITVSDDTVTTNYNDTDTIKNLVDESLLKKKISETSVDSFHVELISNKDNKYTYSITVAGKTIQFAILNEEIKDLENMTIEEFFNYLNDHKAEITGTINGEFDITGGKIYAYDLNHIAYYYDNANYPQEGEFAISSWPELSELDLSKLKENISNIYEIKLDQKFSKEEIISKLKEGEPEPIKDEQAGNGNFCAVKLVGLEYEPYDVFAYKEDKERDINEKAENLKDIENVICSESGTYYYNQNNKKIAEDFNNSKDEIKNKYTYTITRYCFPIVNKIVLEVYQEYNLVDIDGNFALSSINIPFKDCVYYGKVILKRIITIDGLADQIYNKFEKKTITQLTSIIDNEGSPNEIQGEKGADTDAKYQAPVDRVACGITVENAISLEELTKFFDKKGYGEEKEGKNYRITEYNDPNTIRNKPITAKDSEKDKYDDFVEIKSIDGKDLEPQFIDLTNKDNLPNFNKALGEDEKGFLESWLQKAIDAGVTSTNEDKWDQEYKMWVVDSILVIISNDDVDGALAKQNQRAGVVSESGSSGGSGGDDPDSDPDNNPEDNPEDNPENNPEDNPENNPEDNPESNPEDNPENNPENPPTTSTHYYAETTSSINEISTSMTLPSLKINEVLGGNVFIDYPNPNIDNVRNGFRSSEDKGFSGIKVDLYELTTGALSQSTTTDENGNYKFEHLNPLKKYLVKFTYNGQIYEPTYYKYDLSGGFSNGMEVTNDRSALNAKFLKQDSNGINYKVTLAEGQTEWHKSYALDSKIKNKNGDYIETTRKIADGEAYSAAVKFSDLYNVFLSYAVTKKNYEEAYTLLKEALLAMDVTEAEANNVITYIKDCEINAYTSTVDPLGDQYVQDSIGEGANISYPVYDHYVLEDYDNPPGEYTWQTMVSNSTANVENKQYVDYYYVYTSPSNMSTSVDFGLYERKKNDLALTKDVYGVKLRINGKTEKYVYDQKVPNLSDRNSYDAYNRAEMSLYNGDSIYSREIRPSDFFTPQLDEKAKLNAYVTYRITVSNVGELDASINELVDFYDADMYTFHGNLNGDEYTPHLNQQFDANGNTTIMYSDSFEGMDNSSEYKNRISYEEGGIKREDVTNLKFKTVSSLEDSGSARQASIELKANGYNYSPLYITGIETNTKNEANNCYVLQPNECVSVFVTYKVNKEKFKGEDVIKMDCDLKNDTSKFIGKRNIAEINGYSSYYAKDSTEPAYITKAERNTETGEYVIDRADASYSNQIAGIVDCNSNPGNLETNDLDGNGNIKTSTSSSKNKEVDNHLENDTDKSPNMKFKFTLEDTREISGITFEDVRSEVAKTEDGKDANTFVGNGVYDKKDKDPLKIDGKEHTDTLINGVQVQLVELVPELIDDGTPTGFYLGERIWNGYTYKLTNDGYEIIEDKTNYLSGSGKSRVMISGEAEEDGNVLYVAPRTIGEGEYCFTSVPPGDFFVRFIYGSNDETTLTNDEGEGKEVNTLIKKSGLNERSYNGQDYKSTIYQVGMSQEYSYNGINGYIDFDIQNYSNTWDEKKENELEAEKQIDGTRWFINKDNSSARGYGNKATMHFYNLPNGELEENFDKSDAKDVYAYRDRATKYSSTLTNHNNEVLASFKDITTYDFDEKAFEGIDDNTFETVVKDFCSQHNYEYDEFIKTVDDEGNPKDRTRKEILQACYQRRLIDELQQESYGVAQTGVIPVEHEFNKVETENQFENNKNSYQITHLDFGLTKRPEAQLTISKKVELLNITLKNGEVLYSAKSGASNLTFNKHKEHGTGYENKFRMKVPELTTNSNLTPELVQAYIDSEILEGATMQLRYEITLKNVGEIDYLDRKFYYVGVPTSVESNNIAKTNAVRVLDYVSESINYDEDLDNGDNYQSNKVYWGRTTTDDILPSKNNEEFTTDIFAYILKQNEKETEVFKASPLKDDEINRNYLKEALTYQKAIIYSPELTKELLPEVADKDGCKIIVPLTLSVNLSSEGINKATFNNLLEITKISNAVGRRMEYSIVGNQQLADQSLGYDAEEDKYSSLDIVNPSEIDADSSQEVRLLPPTGENKNYTMYIVIAGVVFVIIMIGGLVIRNAMAKEKKAKSKKKTKAKKK